MVGGWTARVRTNTLALTDPIEFTEATLVENFNAPDMLAMDGWLSKLGPALVPSYGIVLFDELGVQRFSGVLTSAERRGDGTGTLIFAGDLVRLWWRLCWPTPASAWSASGQTDAYDSFTGTSEARLLHLVNLNAGPGARTERRFPSLRMPTNLNRGVTARTSARFQTLGELAGQLAEGASVRMNIVQTYVGTTPYLDLTLTDAPDISAWARFGTPEASGPAILGQDWRYKFDMPAANVILSAAAGEGKNRNLNALDDTASAESLLWKQRIEKFLDMRGTGDITSEDKAITDAQEKIAPAEKAVEDAQTAYELAANAKDVAEEVANRNPTSNAAQANAQKADTAWTNAATRVSDKQAALVAANNAVTAAISARTAASAAALVEINKGMAEDLAASVGLREVSVPIASTPTFTIGVDAPLGAKVGAVLDGVLLVERIRQITTVVGGDGPTVAVTAVFGSPDAGPQTPTQKALAAALKRLDKLEKI